MKILHVSAELFPLVKVGGLADVMGALPQALRALGADVRVLMPGFPGVLKGLRHEGEATRIQDVPGVGEARVLKGWTSENVPVYALDIPALYDRPGGPYEESGDSHFKFAALAWAAAQLGLHGDGHHWRPSVVHCHDWQAGLAPVYLAFARVPRPATVISIHNLAYQGIYAGSLLEDLRIPKEAFHMEGVEFHGNINFMKAGLAYADRLATVSPTYAHEIQRPEWGWYLEGLLARRSGDLTGILNGADYLVWSPAHSPHLGHHYDAGRLSGKKVCKNLLQRELGLAEDPDVPLFAVVSRLAPQKGLDLVLDNVDYLASLGAQLAILGTGEPQLQDGFLEAARARPDQVAVRIGFDEGLAHRFLAGADSLLMPSRQEPCGLTQLYALHFGTLPLVRRTGGLADTVVDATPANLAAGTATGFVFEPESAWVLGETLGRACTLYRDQPKVWGELQQRAMHQDFSWRASAQRYLDLYKSLVHPH
jgi:starch synthase